MVNNWDSWNLDYISHGGAHYSEKWKKSDQDAYNKWYYKTHKEKWKKQEENITDMLGKLAELEYDEDLTEKKIDQLMNEKHRFGSIDGDPIYNSIAEELGLDTRNPNWNRAAVANNIAAKAKQTGDYYDDTSSEIRTYGRLNAKQDYYGSIDNRENANLTKSIRSLDKLSLHSAHNAAKKKSYETMVSNSKRRLEADINKDKRKATTKLEYTKYKLSSISSEAVKTGKEAISRVIDRIKR